MGQPAAFVGAVAACVIWAVSGRYSIIPNLAAGHQHRRRPSLTFLAVFLIQNSQNRDGAAIQAKLDELLRAVDKAREQFIGIEHLTDEQIELVRSRAGAARQAAEGRRQGEDRRGYRRWSARSLLISFDVAAVGVLQVLRSASSIARNNSLKRALPRPARPGRMSGPSKFSSCCVSRPTATMRSAMNNAP